MTMQTFTTIRPDDFLLSMTEYRWYGGVTVSMWVDGDEVDMFSMGQDGPLTLEDIVESCERHYAGLQCEDEG